MLAWGNFIEGLALYEELLEKSGKTMHVSSECSGNARNFVRFLLGKTIGYLTNGPLSTLRCRAYD